MCSSVKNQIWSREKDYSGSFVLVLNIKYIGFFFNLK